MWRVFSNPSNQITKNIIYPGAGMVVMAIEASKQLVDSTRILKAFRVQEISFKQALLIPETIDGIEYMVSMRKMRETSLHYSPYWYEFNVSTCDADGHEWTEHCSGRISLEYESLPGEVDNGQEARAEQAEDAETMRAAISVCHRPLTVNNTYDGWDELGITFGPTFQNLKNARLGNGTGHGILTVIVPNVAGSMPKGYAQDHTLQPATLDSVFGTYMVVRTDIAPFNVPELPVFIKELWLAADISNVPGHKFECYTKAQRVSATRYTAQMFLWDDSVQKCRLKLTGIETKPLQSAAADTDSKELYHYIEQKPEIRFLSRQTPIFRNLVPKQSDVDSRIKALKRYQLLTLFYITKALQDIKGAPKQELPQHHRKYIEWLELQVQRASDAALVHYTPSELEHLVQDDDYRAKFMAAMEAGDAREEMLHRVGPQIGRVLKGEVDALGLIFGEDDLIQRFYRESSEPLDLPHLLRCFLETLAHNASNLKIIEVGAGTGSATASVLQALSPMEPQNEDNPYSAIDRYTYTDVSAGFFEKARARFGAWEKILEFKVLDIEASPAEQGFAEGSYDMVVASNVSCDFFEHGNITNMTSRSCMLRQILSQP
jgi:SAM-dependent methyltransferase